MSTRAELKSRFSNGNPANAAAFADLIDSLKVVQSAVSDPAASGKSVTFIATISQSTDGVITVTKKTVDFSGYQTVAGMIDYQTVAAMERYQDLDLQQVGRVTAAAGGSQTIVHKMKHYPTVRLLDSRNIEVKSSEYTVIHDDLNTLTIRLEPSLTGSYQYVLD